MIGTDVTDVADVDDGWDEVVGRGLPYISRDIYLLSVQRMYGDRRVARPVYGKRCLSAAGEGACVSDTVYLEALNALIGAIAVVVSKFFPSFTGYANIIGEMTAETAIPAPLFIRVIWVKEHPDQKYTNSEYQQYEVIDIYLRYGMDWREDPYLTVSLPGSGPPSS
jgi:hypothetical protein